jgi:hypothetical protein
VGITYKLDLGNCVLLPERHHTVWTATIFCSSYSNDWNDDAPRQARTTYTTQQHSIWIGQEYGGNDLNSSAVIIYWTSSLETGGFVQQLDHPEERLVETVYYAGVVEVITERDSNNNGGIIVAAGFQQQQ